MLARFSKNFFEGLFGSFSAQPPIANQISRAFPIFVATQNLLVKMANIQASNLLFFFC